MSSRRGKAVFMFNATSGHEKVQGSSSNIDLCPVGGPVNERYFLPTPPSLLMTDLLEKGVKGDKGTDLFEDHPTQIQSRPHSPPP